MTAKPHVRSTSEPPDPGIVTDSDVMRRAILRAESYARSDLPILVIGATGTGKELFARHIHAVSERRGLLVDVNCAGFPRELVESLLFGHRQGAFTGATRDVVGLVGQASHGTLFLDEVLSLSAEAQAKLLRVIETGQFRPLGAPDNLRSEFRLVTAAQETIISELEAGHFREDLYHRIAGAVIHLPPLCNRPGDAVVLARHFAAGHGRSLGRGAARLLERYPWPGNVRELRMVIDRAVLATEREQLDAGCLADALSQGRLRSPAPASGPRGTNADAPLRAVCAANAWDPTRIADALGVSRATLYRRLRREGLSLRRSGKSHEVS